MTTEYVMRMRVNAVEQKYIKSWLGGVGQDARFANEPTGWFVTLEEGYSFNLGSERPVVEVGDIATVRIRFDGRK